MRYWIKLYTEILDDPKMGRLSDREYRTCITLFALAGREDNDGKLPPPVDMAWRLRMDSTELLEDMRALERLNILEEHDGTWAVRKWQERQAKAPSAAPDKVLQRVHEHRQRERNETVTALHLEVKRGVTPPETETETEVEVETEAETATPALDWWSHWVESFPQGQILNPIDKKNLQAVVSEVGESVVIRAIDHANKHKHTPNISLAYVEAIVDGWRKDGKLNGNGREPPKTPRKRKHFAPDGSMEEMEF